MQRKVPRLEPETVSSPGDGLRDQNILSARRCGEPGLESDVQLMAKRNQRPLKQRLFIALAALLLGLTIVPVLLLRFLPAWTSSFMLQYQIERLHSSEKLPPQQQQWVRWESISPTIKLAVIAAEDQRFAEHFGIDFRAIRKAIGDNRGSGSRRGASTITQQTAKNLFLWSGGGFLRKGIELGYSLLIELCWPKQRILEVYLNIAEFGLGIYGVEAAAQHYFNKPADKLSASEAALMAAVLPNPKRFKVAAPSTYVQTRAVWIQGQMRQLGEQHLSKL